MTDNTPSTNPAKAAKNLAQKHRRKALKAGKLETVKFAEGQGRKSPLELMKQVCDACGEQATENPCTGVVLGGGTRVVTGREGEHNYEGTYRLMMALESDGGEKVRLRVYETNVVTVDGLEKTTNIQWEPRHPEGVG